jgi:hypothetical protein
MKDPVNKSLKLIFFIFFHDFLRSSSTPLQPHTSVSTQNSLLMEFILPLSNQSALEQELSGFLSCVSQSSENPVKMEIEFTNTNEGDPIKILQLKISNILGNKKISISFKYQNLASNNFDFKCVLDFDQGINKVEEIFFDNSGPFDYEGVIKSNDVLNIKKLHCPGNWISFEGDVFVEECEWAPDNIISLSRFNKRWLEQIDVLTISPQLTDLKERIEKETKSIKTHCVLECLEGIVLVKL